MYECVHTRRSEKTSDVGPSTLLEIGSLAGGIIQQADWSMSSKGSSCLHLPSLCTNTMHHLSIYGFWGLELRSSCMCSKHFTH